MKLAACQGVWQLLLFGRVFFFLPQLSPNIKHSHASVGVPCCSISSLKHHFINTTQKCHVQEHFCKVEMSFPAVQKSQRAQPWRYWTKCLIKKMYILSAFFKGLRPGYDGAVLWWAGGRHLPGLLLLRHSSHVQLDCLQRASHLAWEEVTHKLKSSTCKAF